NAPLEIHRSSIYCCDCHSPLLCAQVSDLALTLCLLYSYSSYDAHRDLASFPTRRSSDLSSPSPRAWSFGSPTKNGTSSSCTTSSDRKSTRLNSSHVKISYAVFCLKKKKTKKIKERMIASSNILCAKKSRE